MQETELQDLRKSDKPIVDRTESWQENAKDSQVAGSAKGTQPHFKSHQPGPQKKYAGWRPIRHEVADIPPETRKGKVNADGSGWIIPILFDVKEPTD